MTAIWFSLFDLAFSTLFVLAFLAIIDRFKGGDGGTFLKVRHWFTRSFGNTSDESKAFLPRFMHYTVLDLGWTRRRDLETDNGYIWERPDGVLYHSEVEIPEIIVYPGALSGGEALPA